MVFILIGGFIFASLFIGAILYLANRKQYEINKRMKQYTAGAGEKARQEDDILNKPFSQRVFWPVLKSFSKIISRFTKTRSRDKLQQSLQLAGNPGNLKAQEFLALHYLFVALAAGGTWGLLFLTGKRVDQQLLISCMAGVAAFMGGRAYLSSQTRKRQTAIQKELPAALDLLCVSVEAGLSFDSGMLQVVEKSRGQLSREFKIALQEMQMGKPRREALRDMGSRTGVEDLILFVGALIQADQLGVSIAKILRTQADQVRMKRRQRIEEKAMKAPVKMLFPLVFFIFPCIFMVLLGPAVIKIYNVLINGH